MKLKSGSQIVYEETRAIENGTLVRKYAAYLETTDRKRVRLAGGQATAEVLADATHSPLGITWENVKSQVEADALAAAKQRGEIPASD